MQFSPILTPLSIIVFDPITVFLPIFTFLPIKTLLPNLTNLNFLITGFFKDNDNQYLQMGKSFSILVKVQKGHF